MTSLVTDADVASFRADGFVAVGALADPVALEAVRRACDEVLSRRVAASGDRLLGGRIRQVVLPHQDHPVFDANPVLDAGLEVARRLLGSERVVRVYDQVIHKPAGDPHETPWHQDQAYVAEPVAPAGMPIGRNAAMFWVALDDVDETNSCMHFLPGAHERPLLPHHVAAGEPTDPGRLLAITHPAAHLDLDAAVAVPLPAGGCTVHGPGTPHMTPPNTSPDRGRRAYIFAVAAS